METTLDFDCESIFITKRRFEIDLEQKCIGPAVYKNLEKIPGEGLMHKPQFLERIFWANVLYKASEKTRRPKAITRLISKSTIF